jgi:hypothetical protein
VLLFPGVKAAFTVGVCVAIELVDTVRYEIAAVAWISLNVVFIS